jgi:hypothetical protein
MGTRATEKIKRMVADSCGVYSFRRRGHSAKGDLIRMDRSGHVDRLVDGHWIEVTRRPAHDDLRIWRPIEEQDLARRVRRFQLADLNSERIAARPGSRRRSLRATAVWAWLIPPLQGGAARKLTIGKVQKRCRDSYVEDLRGVKGDDLLEIKAQILDGYEAALERISRVEGRANLFLGASVLTSSLVLANAGLLLSHTDGLKAPYLQIAAAVLALAGGCAIIAAFRALQTTLFTFSRATPTAAKKVHERRRLKGKRLTREYVAALFIATDRLGVVGDWKVGQMKAARGWILATTAGVVALTIVVLADAVWG